MAGTAGTGCGAAYNSTNDRTAPGLPGRVGSVILVSLSKMKHRHQKLMAVVMVTAALCADTAILAAPSVKPAMGQIAARFVDRLTRKLGHAVQGVKLHQDRSISDHPAMLLVAVPAEAPAVHQPVSPFQFRLPPPLG